MTCIALSALFICMTASTALAQKNPTFQYDDGKTRQEVAEIDLVEWKATAQGSLILTTGNAETRTISGALKISRKWAQNKLQLEAGGAYGRADILRANDDNEDGRIGGNEIRRETETTNQSWQLKARYDRFLTEKNAIYVLGTIGADEPAGKELMGGGQAGYSRLLFAVDDHELASEIGYDLSYEDYLSADGVAIHSMRLFAGYSGKLSADTGVDASVETLLNVNSLDTPTGEADPFEDVRVTGKLALTTKLLENISFRFGFEAKFDNVPAPLPAFSVPFADGITPEADKLDTKTEASVIVNFI